MSQRTLLFAALVLMAGGLLLGGLDLVFGNVIGGVPVQSEQGPGPGGQQGPAGGFLPRRPGFVPGVERGEGIGKIVPRPAASPQPRPTA